ncbi:hypothetical protein YC2023_065781 [Brassica napus]
MSYHANEYEFHHPQIHPKCDVKVHRFEFGRCTIMYKIIIILSSFVSSPQQLLRKCSPVLQCIIPQKFILWKFDYLQVLANTNLELLHILFKFKSTDTYSYICNWYDRTYNNFQSFLLQMLLDKIGWCKALITSTL